MMSNSEPSTEVTSSYYWDKVHLTNLSHDTLWESHNLCGISSKTTFLTFQNSVIEHFVRAVNKDSVNYPLNLLAKILHGHNYDRSWLLSHRFRFTSSLSYTVNVNQVPKIELISERKFNIYTAIDLSYLQLKSNHPRHGRQIWKISE